MTFETTDLSLCAPSSASLASPPRKRYPSFVIAFHPALDRIGDRIILTGLSYQRDLHLSRSQPMFAPSDKHQSQPLQDAAISRSPIVISQQGDMLVFDCSKSRTSLHVDGHEVKDLFQIPISRFGQGFCIVLAGRVVLYGCLTENTAHDLDSTFGMVGQSDAMLDLRRTIARCADLNTAVLIRGETGTGKELVASALHRHHPYRKGQFVAVDMGTLQPQLAAAQLFGADRGAYTGAIKSSEGFFRQANGGTLFLDEIGETPPEVQVQLLRVLETSQVQAIGSSQSQSIDVRLIAATDADLEQKIDAKNFNQALYFRLASFECRIPPLRERREDIGPLLRKFLIEECAATQQSHRLEAKHHQRYPFFPSGLILQLIHYDWPGNVRQLRNIVRQMVIDNRGRSQFYLAPHLDQQLRTAPQVQCVHFSNGSKHKRASEITPDEVSSALADNHWELMPTARQLGISRPTLYKLIKQSDQLRTAKDLAQPELEEMLRKHAGHVQAMAEDLKVSASGLSRRLKDLGMKSSKNT